MGNKRRSVQCWFCGKRAQRVPSARGLRPSMIDENGHIKVVLRKRTVQPYGVCGSKKNPWHGEMGCPQPMLLPKDARFVLRASIQYERCGHNKMSEIDCNG